MSFNGRREQRPANGRNGPLATGGKGALAGSLVDGDFLMRRLVARGGESLVYLARQQSVADREVALKVVDPALWRLLQRGREAPENPYAREVRITSMVHHIAFAEVFRAGTLPDGRPYVAMEYVAGPTLGESVARHGVFSLDAAAALVLQLTDALHALHRRNVLFRDLKPEHVIIAPWTMAPFRVRLLDLGHALPSYQTDSAVRHGAGEPMGTPGYMAPEAARGAAMDERSDLFAMALLVYEALTGRRAVDVADRRADTLVAYTLSNEPIPAKPLDELRPDLPPAIHKLMQQTLDRNPRKRPDSALQFRERFLAALADSDAAAGETRGFVARVRALWGGRKHPGQTQ